METLVFALFFPFLLFSASSKTSLDICRDAHKGPCKRSSQCFPKITPSNSTHLLVNWEDVFEGCESSHIEQMEIQIRRGESHQVDFKQKHANFEANPCLKHTIVIRMFMAQSYAVSYGRSLLKNPYFEYNQIDVQNINYPFSGLLQTEVISKICLKKKGTITIPSPPEALKQCGVTSGDFKDNDFNEVGTTGNVKLSFKNPQNPNTNTYKNFEVKDIQMCQSGNTDTVTMGLIIATAISSTIAVITSTCLVVVCCKRWLKKGKGKRTEKQDKNNIYGLYYDEDGQNIDQGIVEVVDFNAYYG